MVVEISTLAYSKMVLHALKYPQYTTRGVLLGRIVTNKTASDESSEDASLSLCTNIIDAIPALHNTLLAPNIESLLIHLDAYCEKENLQIVGFYFANQRLNDSSFDDVWGKIALDKLQSPVVLQIENSKLSLNSTTSCLQTFFYDAGKWRQKQCMLENGEDTVNVASIAVQNKLYRELFDFENHLDHPTAADFFNMDLSLKLDTMIQ